MIDYYKKPCLSYTEMFRNVCVNIEVDFHSVTIWTCNNTKKGDLWHPWLTLRPLQCPQSHVIVIWQLARIYARCGVPQSLFVTIITSFQHVKSVGKWVASQSHMMLQVWQSHTMLYFMTASLIGCWQSQLWLVRDWDLMYALFSSSVIQLNEFYFPGFGWNRSWLRWFWINWAEMKTTFIYFCTPFKM